MRRKIPSRLTKGLGGIGTHTPRTLHHLLSNGSNGLSKPTGGSSTDVRLRDIRNARHRESSDSRGDSTKARQSSR